MNTERPWNTSLSGLVITLTQNVNNADSTIAAIRRNPAITVGKPEGQYLPVTIENTNARQIHQWLESLNGVSYIDVVYCAILPTEEPITN